MSSHIVKVNSAVELSKLIFRWGRAFAKYSLITFSNPDEIVRRFANNNPDIKINQEARVTDVSQACLHIAEEIFASNVRLMYFIYDTNGHIKLCMGRLVQSGSIVVFPDTKLNANTMGRIFQEVDQATASI